MFSLGRKNNTIIRKKKSVFQIRIGISPILKEMKCVSEHKKAETIFCRKNKGDKKNEQKLLLDLKFERKRFKLSHPILLCFRS